MRPDRHKLFTRARRLIGGSQTQETGREIAFLHIGKCAGTQIVHLAAQIEEQTGVRIVKHAHRVDLSRIRPDQPYFFPIRDPISRFRSGFYSRKRKGQPRVLSEWSPAEARAFADFEHANDLAESLFEPGERGGKALMAVQSISHTAMQQVDWFTRNGYMFLNRPPLWIIRQEHFATDMDRFLARAGLGVTMADLCTAEDRAAAHATDYSEIPPLSETARAKLALWYARDIEFYRVCEDWMARQAQA
ncbi:hypothetical protein [Amaricoccus macauensis]|uniref:hypothetical protein n=1 Tax=Amaricoccus macauensis TaxID=57001 RepID=UPI003C7AF492